jgi:gamma-glutamyltranspeptidase/glutathione hydrolase
MTLGLGSGVWLPGLGVHLNSMLGEGELITADLMPGGRMSSMMCPLVVIDDDGELLVAAGSAGASRIRTALVHTLVNILIKNADMTTAINHPRFHVVADPDGGAPVAHIEPGYPADEVDALVSAGYQVHWWEQADHYFGGASAVGHAGAAGDPRRGGVGRLA